MRDSGSNGLEGLGFGGPAGQPDDGGASGYGGGPGGYGPGPYGSGGYGQGGYGQGGYGPGGYGPGGYGPGGYGPGGYRPRRRRRAAGVLSHLAVAVLVAAASVAVTIAVYHPGSNGASTAGAGSSPATTPPGAGVGAVPGPAASPSGSASPAGGSEQQVVNKVEPGLVVIDTVLQYNSEAEAGTGMVINSDGLVLTNNHVIEDATKMTATVVATGKRYPATVVGYDKTGDIALIRLTGASGLTTIPVGNSDSLTAGERVIALGNAQGQGTILPAAGQITGLGKTIQAGEQGGSATPETLHGMIQTDAGIVSGDSGGPLSTTAGQVIGMDTAANTVSFTQQQSTGFAIPINTALSVARQIASGRASSGITVGYPPFVGVFTAGGSSSSPQVQAEQQQAGGVGGFGFGFGGGTPACYQNNANMTVPSSVAPVRSGTLIDGVICGSPAARAGITSGSVITAVDGHAIGAPDSLTGTLARYRPGESISVSWVSPGGQHTTSDIRLAAGPPA